MTDSGGSSSMGDLFNQRRAARRSQQPQTAPSPASNNRPQQQRSSFLDIQAEQEREQQRYNNAVQQARSPYNHNRGSDFSYRGGGRSSDSYGGGGRSDNYGGGGRSSDSYGAGRSSNYDDYGRRGNETYGRSSRGGGYHRQQQQRGPDYSSMPIEQGLVASLKDSFGFIYCADREDEIFFHYSEVKGCHPDELLMDTEVEFRVGPSSRNADKMAAYQVQILKPGTIVWETEDEPNKTFRGMVERPVRSERGSNQVAEGTIRLLEEASEGLEEEESPQPAKTGPLVRFTANDYTPPAPDSNKMVRRSDSAGSFSSKGGSRLGRGDLVEFSLVTERRTGDKAARSIKLIQSERERQRIAKEKELLANATLEQGVVTTLKSDFGFLKSNRRREEVYFHYSNVNLPNDKDGEDVDHVLKEGQDMEFLVVTEPGSGGRKEKLSARKVEFLPSGSVVFHTEIAQGVTGVITRCPHAVDSSYADEMVGRVQLTKPITQKNDDGTETVVSEVVFKAADAPGGSFAANRDGSSVGLWVREGDTLLFDVVKELVDDAYCASPTKHTCPLADATDEGEEAPPKDGKKEIRMVSLSPAGRAEGVVHALKDNYGFISCAERPIDTYFRFYEVLPDDVQAELRENMQLMDTKKPTLAVGAEVQFDLFLQGMVPASNSRSRRGGEKESMKAQRILVLPPGTITQTKVIAKDVKGIVSKEDPKQPYAGMIELEEELKSMSLEELHPLAAKLVDSMLADDASIQSVVFPDLQSIKEDQVVMKMVEARGRGELECTYIPDSRGGAVHPGRLCIKRIVATEEAEPKNEQAESENNGGDAPEKEASPDLVSEVDEAGDADKGDTTPSKPKHPRKKKKGLVAKTIKTVRFDKHCLVPELQSGMPPEKDDVVICDVIQSRRSGMVSLTNVRVIERKQIERGATLDGGESGEKASGIGIVTEVVASRQFGFISVLDENAAKREMLFFHTSSVVANDGGVSSTPSKSSRTSNSAVRKGDEVKFDTGTGKNGKRVATNITIVPKGTLNIPTTTEKNACRGFILMEPSHTSLANTPLRQSRHGPGSQGKATAGVGAGRWVNVGTEDLARTSSGSSVKEEGSILLLSDPSHMFGGQRKPKNKNGDPSNSGLNGEDVNDSNKAETSNAEEAGMDASGTEASADDSKKNESSTAEESGLDSSKAESSVDSDPQKSCICRRLPYKNGGLAMHGPGATSSADASSAPRRGDLVSFMKAKSGKGVRDIRLVTRGAATRVTGKLVNIKISASSDEEQQEEGSSPGTADFVAATEKEEMYNVDLNEVVSCDVSILKENVAVEGILHDGKMYGICRTTDLYLESKLGPSHKERPKLNLTVRKELTKNLGGKIMAQSMMAKGPDGTNGFALGWTTRVSQYAAAPEVEEVSGSADSPPSAEEAEAVIDGSETAAAE